MAAGARSWGIVDLAASAPHAVPVRPPSAHHPAQQQLALQRVIRPARPHEHGVLCGYTQLVVRLLGGDSQLQPRQDGDDLLLQGTGALAILGVHACGRQGTPSLAGRCPRHKGAAPIEVWAVRGGGGGSGAQGRRRPVQAMKLFGCESTDELAAFLLGRPQGGHVVARGGGVVFEDHWGELGVRYEQLLAGDGVPLQPQAPAALVLPQQQQQQQPATGNGEARRQELPLWRR